MKVSMRRTSGRSALPLRTNFLGPRPAFLPYGLILNFPCCPFRLIEASICKRGKLSSGALRLSRMREFLIGPRPTAQNKITLRKGILLQKFQQIGTYPLPSTSSIFLQEGQKNAIINTGSGVVTKIPGHRLFWNPLRIKQSANWY